MQNLNWPYARLEVAALDIPPSVRHNLQCAGFRTVADMEGVQLEDLAAGTVLRVELNTADLSTKV